MNKEAIIPISVTQQPETNQFALQQVLKQGSAFREYKINDEWIQGNPGGKPDQTRIKMDLERFRRARSVYSFWKDIASSYAYDPVLPEEIIARLMKTDTEVTFFIPWGVRGQGSFGAREEEAMSIVDAVVTGCTERKIEANVLLMPADVYATEVNKKVSVQQSASYFSAVSREGEKRRYQVLPWSRIREQNMGTYQKLIAEYTSDYLMENLPESLQQMAIRAATKNSGYTSKNDILMAANAYLRERLSEAIIIDSVYQPIKLSMAPKNKDNIVDGPLPRLYLIPERLTLPWIGGL